MERLLDFIVPIYGKDPEEVFLRLKKLTQNKVDGIGWIIVYKNSIDNSLNYDNLFKLKNDNTEIFKGEFHWKKTNKIKLGISKSKAKFIMPMDGHHSIKTKLLRKVVAELQEFDKNQISIIWEKYIAFNTDRHMRDYIGPPRKAATSGNQVIRRSLLKLDDIDYDIIFSDDFTYGLNVMVQDNISYADFKTRFYLRQRGKSVSSTYGKKDSLKAQKIFEDAIFLFDHFLEKTWSKYKNTGIETFSKEYILSFQQMFNYTFQMYLKKDGLKFKDRKIHLLNFLNNDLLKANMLIEFNKKAFKPWPWIWRKYKYLNYKI